MRIISLISTLLFLLTASVFANAAADTDTYDYETLKTKYYADQPGKGKYADLWEPIPIQQYWNPITFYKPPQTIKGDFKAAECVTCHKGMFQPKDGQTACEQCNVGMYGPSEGAATCLACEPHKYSNTKCATTCNLCDAGTDSQKGWTVCCGRF